MPTIVRNHSVLFLAAVIVGLGAVLGSYDRLSYAQSEGNPVVSPSASPRWRVVEVDEPEWRQNIPLSRMASQSLVIAVGVPLRNVCRQLQDGTVVTEYSVRLEEVLKGNRAANEIAVVRMPGGRITESDGTILEARTRKVRKMQNGKRYVMFLKNTPGGSNSFTIIHGSQGLFEIPANGSRVIHLGRSFLLPPADDGDEIGSFFERLRGLFRNR